MYIVSPKRKMRGWKRRKRKIEEWKQRVINLDMNGLMKHGQNHTEPWTHRDYNLSAPKIAPLWYNRLFLEAMLDVYLNRHQQMIDRGEEFYLKLWLFDPHFYRSKIITACGEYSYAYDCLLHQSQEEKPFPYHKFAYLEDRLEAFEWKLYIDNVVYAESKYSADEIEKIKRKCYKEIVGVGERLYCVKVGDVWIGTLKGIKNARIERDDLTMYSTTIEERLSHDETD